MSSISFFAQDQSARAAAASINSQFDATNATLAKLFAAGSNPNVAPSVISAAAGFSNSVVNPFGQAFLNAEVNSAVLAAQEGNARVNKLNANINASTTAANGDLSSQVTFDGALPTNFGKDGPAPGGGFSFLQGADLQTAFKIAFGSKTSNGEAINTVSVVGDTLTGSTSGPNAHDVFTLTLHRDSGLFTFQLLAPVDQSTKKGSFNKIFLQGLLQATTSTGAKIQFPTIELDVYNNYGSATNLGNGALLHEGSLTSRAAASVNTNAVNASTSSTKTLTKAPRIAPIDPRTNHPFTTSTSAQFAEINSVNIFS